MESLFLEIVPDLYDRIGDFITAAFSFFAGGILLAILFWTIGFAIGELFGLVSREITNGRG